MIWLISLAVFGSLFLLLPLLRPKSQVLDSGEVTPSILIDQLKEVERDQSRGLITENEAKAATQEIKRHILLEARRTKSPLGKGGSGKLGLILGALFVPVFGVAYYSVMGSPEISSLSVAQRAQSIEEERRISEIAARVKASLVEEPNGGTSEGWMLLGQTYSKMKRYSEAAQAFEIVSLRPEANSAVFSMLGEALIAAEQGVVTPKAEKAIETALEMDPQNPAAVFYKAIALEQSGQSVLAHETLIARLESADTYYPWMDSLLIQANRIGAEIGIAPSPLSRFAPVASGPGPTQQDIANAENMSDEDRQAFIRSMVNRLALRLEDAPDDLDGWIRLGNAYKVLGEVDLSISAFERAQEQLQGVADNDPRHQLVRDALLGLGRANN